MFPLSGQFLSLVASLTSAPPHSNLALVWQSGKFSGSSPAAPSQPQGLSYAEDAAEHENMKAVLKTSSPALEDATPMLGVRTRSRASRGTLWWQYGGGYSQGGPPQRNGLHRSVWVMETWLIIYRKVDTSGIALSHQHTGMYTQVLEMTIASTFLLKKQLNENAYK